MGQFAASVIPPAKAALRYAEGLVKDLKPEDGARLPKGVKCNHAVWALGHLSLYPDKLLQAIGRPELCKPDQRFEELFADKKECLDDPGGKLYPSLHEVMERFRERYNALLNAVAEVPESVFAGPNPNERMKEIAPTVGAMVVFMLTGHTMMHLGQISTWRRCLGYGPVF